MLSGTVGCSLVVVMVVCLAPVTAAQGPDAAAAGRTVSVGSRVGQAGGAVAPLAGSNVSVPRFCTCAQCVFSPTSPPGCGGSSSNRWGYPQVASADWAASPLFRQWEGRFSAVPASTPGRAMCYTIANYTTRKDPTAGAVTNLEAECDATLTAGLAFPDEVHHTAAFVRWDSHSGYWVPVTMAGDNITGIDALAQSMCPYAVHDARAWVDLFVKSGGKAPGSSQWKCLCGSIAWASKGAGAVRHGSGWTNTSLLPAGVYPYLSYAADDCFCNPTAAASPGPKLWPSRDEDTFAATAVAYVNEIIVALVMRELADAGMSYKQINQVFVELSNLNCSAVLHGGGRGATETRSGDFVSVDDDDPHPPGQFCDPGCKVQACKK